MIAEDLRGNDLVVSHDGGIYVTNPAANGTDPSKIWYISPKGEKKVVDTGLKFSNGICLSPDHSLLMVADYRSHWVYSYQVQADGSLAHKQKYCHLHEPDTADDSGADGIRCDRDGRIWVATRLGLQICDQPGRVTCIIPTPNGRVSNLTFGGEQFDTLYCTCGDRVYSRKVKVRVKWMGTPRKARQPAPVNHDQTLNYTFDDSGVAGKELVASRHAARRLRDNDAGERPRLARSARGLSTVGLRPSGHRRI